MNDCEFCNNTGYIIKDVPHQHPDFGRAVPCPKCDIGKNLQRMILERRFKSSGLPTRYQLFSFESFMALPAPAQDGKLEAYEAAYQFASHPYQQVKIDGISRNSLVFYGILGTGKTGLASCAFNSLQARGCEVLYMRVDDVMVSLRDTWRGGADESEAERLQRFQQVNILLLDELQGNDSFNIPAHQKSYMESIIRVRNANQLPTLITTNMRPIDVVEIWGDRMAEALFEMAHFVLVDGISLRTLGA